jgi:hypothetical protein
LGWGCKISEDNAVRAKSLNLNHYPNWQTI